MRQVLAVALMGLQAFRDGALFDPYNELFEANQLAAKDFEELQRSCPQP